MKIRHLLLGVAIVTAYVACSGAKQDKLPILGEKEYITTVREGVSYTDNLFHTVPWFPYLYQDSSCVTPETFKGNVYMAVFLSTLCPTICPIIASILLTIAKHFEDDDRFAILSPTI